MFAIEWPFGIVQFAFLTLARRQLYVHNSAPITLKEQPKVSRNNYIILTVDIFDSMQLPKK